MFFRSFVSCWASEVILIVELARRGSNGEARDNFLDEDDTAPPAIRPLRTHRKAKVYLFEITMQGIGTPFTRVFKKENATKLTKVVQFQLSSSMPLGMWGPGIAGSTA